MPSEILNTRLTDVTFFMTNACFLFPCFLFFRSFFNNLWRVFQCISAFQDLYFFMYPVSIQCTIYCKSFTLFLRYFRDKVCRNKITGSALKPIPHHLINHYVQSLHSLTYYQLFTSYHFFSAASPGPRLRGL